MTNTKAKPAPKTVAAVEIRMLCILSGNGWAVGAGEVAKVSPDEATRLIGLGAAVRVAA